MISSTELIKQWEEKELPMLREKDFRGDAERMAYTAFGDGFAFGVNVSKLTWQDMKRIVEISDEIIEKTPMEELNNNGERWFYEEVLKRYKANENGVSV